MTLGGKAVTVRNPANALKYVADAAHERNARLIARTDLGDELEAIADSYLNSRGLQVVKASPSAFDLLKQAELGVTLAHVGVAESATIGIVFERSLDLLVSALPYIHIAILPQRSLVKDLFELEGFLREKTKNGSSRTVSLITGPSRTADVEQILIRGVHGPNELRVIVVEGE